jgi:hypothetical protein
VRDSGRSGIGGDAEQGVYIYWPLTRRVLVVRSKMYVAVLFRQISQVCRSLAVVSQAEGGEL